MTNKNLSKLKNKILTLVLALCLTFSCVMGLVACGDEEHTEKDPTATKFSEITYDEVYTRGLKVMDLTATALCKENNLPIVVFDMDTPGNLAKVIAGEPIGTLVY